MKQGFFDHVLDAFEGFADDAHGTVHASAHGRGLKVWFGPTDGRSAKEHYEAQLIRVDGGVACEIGFHAEHRDPVRVGEDRGDRFHGRLLEIIHLHGRGPHDDVRGELQCPGRLRLRRRLFLGRCTEAHEPDRHPRQPTPTVTDDGDADRPPFADSRTRLRPSTREAGGATGAPVPRVHRHALAAQHAVRRCAPRDVGVIGPRRPHDQQGQQQDRGTDAEKVSTSHQIRPSRRSP